MVIVVYHKIRQVAYRSDRVLYCLKFHLLKGDARTAETKGGISAAALESVPPFAKLPWFLRCAPLQVNCPKKLTGKEYDKNKGCVAIAGR